MVIIPSQGLKGALIRGDVTKMKIWKGIVNSFDPQLKVPTVDIEISERDYENSGTIEQIWDPVSTLFLMIKDLVAEIFL